MAAVEEEYGRSRRVRRRRIVIDNILGLSRLLNSKPDHLPVTVTTTPADHHTVLEGEGVSLSSFILEFYDTEEFHFPARFFEEQARSAQLTGLDQEEENERQQKDKHMLKNLSGGIRMVFTGFLAILCGLLSFNLGRNRGVTHFLIKSCNFVILGGIMCIVISVVLLFARSRHLSSLLNIPTLLFLVAIGLLSICVFICFLLVQLSY